MFGGPEKMLSEALETVGIISRFLPFQANHFKMVTRQVAA